MGISSLNFKSPIFFRDDRNAVPSTVQLDWSEEALILVSIEYGVLAKPAASKFCAETIRHSLRRSSKANVFECVK